MKEIFNAFGVMSLWTRTLSNTQTVRISYKLRQCTKTSFHIAHPTNKLQYICQDLSSTSTAIMCEYHYTVKWSRDISNDSVSPHLQFVYVSVDL